MPLQEGNRGLLKDPGYKKDAGLTTEHSLHRPFGAQPPHLQRLAVRVHQGHCESMNAYLEDVPMKTVDAVERGIPKSEAALLSIIVNRCRRLSALSERRTP